MNEIFYNKPTNNNNNGISTKTGKEKKGGMVNVCGIILAGNGPLKSQLYQSPFLKHYITSSIITIMDINYGGKFGFYEAVRKCSNLLKQNELEKENKLIEDIMDLIANDTDDGNGNIVSIGFDETLYAINLNVAKYVVISSGYYKYAIKLMTECKENDTNNIKTMKQVKFAKNDIELKEITKEMLNNDENERNNNSDSIEIESFIRFFDQLCDENNIDLKIIGLHSPLTQQFAKGLSGCVAVLHFAINLNNNHDDDDEEWLSDD